MVSIYKRKNENGTTVWRAVIRIKGYPTISKSFARKQEADDSEEEQRRRIRNGQFNFTAHNKHHTYVDLLHRMETDGAFSLQRSFKHCKSQYDYWRERLGVYGLTHITSRNHRPRAQTPPRFFPQPCDHQPLHRRSRLNPHLCRQKTPLDHRKSLPHPFQA